VSRRYRVSTVRAERVVRFIEEFLVVPEGKDVGRPVRLRDWQLEFIDKVYSTPTRRAILSMGRKNGKSAITAMLLLAHLAGPEALPNSQSYSAAQSRDQASLVFGLAAKMVRMSPDLNAMVTVRDSAKVLFCHVHGTTYRALSADATTAYGLSPVLAIHDELGQVVGPRSELYDAIETAMGAHAEPLSIVISTQAPSDADLLSTLIRDAETGADRRSGPSSTGCSASPPDRKEAGQSSPVASQHNRSLLKGALGGG
jgi:phage terminase large subunit-like protein